MSGQMLAASLLAGLLAVAGLLTAPLERRGFGSDRGTARKLVVYGAGMVLSWALTVIAARIYPWASLLVSPGEPAAWLPAPAISAPILVAVLAAFAFVALMPLAQSLRGLRWRRAYAAAIRRSYSKLPGMLPNNGAERAAFVLVSLTAGICEEVLYRGFLIRFLHEGPLALPLLGALAASSLAFGVGHAYQGSRRILSTALAGFAFGLLFLLSGSLVPCVLLHALVDLQAVYVLRPIPEDTKAIAEAA